MTMQRVLKVASRGILLLILIFSGFLLFLEIITLFTEGSFYRLNVHKFLGE